MTRAHALVMLEIAWIVPFAMTCIAPSTPRSTVMRIVISSTVPLSAPMRTTSPRVY
jgi:hypothetical protein